MFSQASTHPNGSQCDPSFMLINNKPAWRENGRVLSDNKDDFMTVNAHPCFMANKNGHNHLINSKTPPQPNDGKLTCEATLCWICSGLNPQRRGSLRGATHFTAAKGKAPREYCSCYTTIVHFKMSEFPRYGPSGTKMWIVYHLAVFNSHPSLSGTLHRGRD